MQWHKGILGCIIEDNSTRIRKVRLIDLQCVSENHTVKNCKRFRDLGTLGVLADLPSDVSQYGKNIWTTKRLFSKQRITRSYARKQ